jgi:hypothetical protein
MCHVEMHDSPAKLSHLDESMFNAEKFLRIDATNWDSSASFSVVSYCFPMRFISTGINLMNKRFDE